MENELATLKEKVAQLQKQLLLHGQISSMAQEEKTVIVPAEIQPLFDVAQKTVSDYFKNLKLEPQKGTIEINDQRYVLIRASALSVDFLTTIQNLYADRGEAEALSIGKNLLFDLAHTLGINDAQNFHHTMKLTVPMAKLSAGPVHFAYTGWAFVEILPESNPSPDENFCLIYNHPFSFEADSWRRSGKVADTAVCIMSAGYSSGWCEESFGIPLTAVEVSCIGKGDDTCTFIMSPPDKIQEHLLRYNPKKKNKIQKQTTYDIPTYFERKKVEEEMQRSKALAESSVKTKEDFISNMSHELRTPLGAVLGFTELLSKTKLDVAQQEYVSAINSSGSNLLTIINDILDLSKLDAGKLEVENEVFSLPEFMHSLAVMFATQAINKNLAFSVSTDSSINSNVKGDSLRLTQILINLTGNAIKFTEAGAVELSCNLKNEHANAVTVEFVVKDTGIGVAPHQQQMIFERFTQADNNITRKYGGTGLGLAITKELVELLGGNLILQSEEGQGATFSFALNFEKVAFEPAPKVVEAALTLAEHSGKSILVVEDNLLNQKLTSIILTNNAFNYSIASNGQEAIDILQKQSFDLVLMDIQMPVLDGCQATGIIRKQLNLQMPIIAMTAHAMAGELEKCRQHGLNDYLPKPFSEKDLIRKINHWLANGHSKINRVTDLSFLRKQTRDNEAVIKEMASTFVTQIPAELIKIKHSIDAKDFYKIFEGLHAFRNSIGLFGFPESIMGTILEMENNAKAETGMDSIRSNFILIEDACNIAVLEMETEIKSIA